MIMRCSAISMDPCIGTNECVANVLHKASMSVASTARILCRTCSPRCVATVGLLNKCINLGSLMERLVERILNRKHEEFLPQLLPIISVRVAPPEPHFNLRARSLDGGAAASVDRLCFTRTLVIQCLRKRLFLAPILIVRRRLCLSLARHCFSFFVVLALPLLWGHYVALACDARQKGDARTHDSHNAWFWVLCQRLPQAAGQIPPPMHHAQC